MIRICLMIILGIPTVMLSQITYHKDISPIINKHCISCHQEGDIGPMPLTNFDEVSSYARMIEFVTSHRIMPPFKAATHNVSYKNDRTLSDSEINLISKWIKTGIVEGTDNSSQRKVKKEDMKISSNYDQTICMEQAFEHYGIYYDQYQAFVLPLDIPSDRIVSEIYFEPGNRDIVRSASLSIANKGTASKMDKWDPRYGYFTYGNLGIKTELPHWSQWFPHTEDTQVKNKEESLLLPKNTELLLHIHYGPFGKIQKDSSCIHLNFSREDHLYSSIQNIPFVIPEFSEDTFLINSNTKVRHSSSFFIPQEIRLRSISPLAHLLCRNWKVIAVLPDRTSVSLVSIEDWDFQWKEKYTFYEPIILPPGTRIISSAVYDNTLDNPYNPADPPHTMKQGPHMFDENFTCYFEIISNFADQAYFEKPFSVLTETEQSIKVHIQDQDIYTIVLHDMSTQENKILLTKTFTKGNHILKNSLFPIASGRYALSISNSDGVNDSWYFVKP